MMKHRLVPALIILLALAGCVVEPPPPALIDPTGFVTYLHPSGVFQISMPPDWVINDISDERALHVEFSPPGEDEPQVIIYVVSASPESADEEPDALFAAQLEAYQEAFYGGGEATYKEIARDAQHDGSLRLSLVVDAPQGATQRNDFVQIIGPYFVALRTWLPVDAPAQLRTLGRVVNTFEVDASAAWGSASQESAETAVTNVIGFASLNTWVDRAGGFQIVGQIVNNGTLPLEFVRVQAQLYDAENRLMVEQDDFVSSDVIQPGEYVPFSLVFSDGLPAGTVRYELHAVARYATFTVGTFYGAENFAIVSSAEFDDNGLLVISGQVRNEGTQAADLIKVIVTVFDDQRRVIGTDTTLVTQQYLAPGETSPFTVTFTELGGVADTFLVTAQAVIAE